tara:strand:+ start:529 stop:768 length:240 start_codon:yes stop_codon:yes gene_type:complete
MGEARRRADQGLPPRQSNNLKEASPKVTSWLPLTIQQREKFFEITKLGSWIGIGLLLTFWIIVRFVGPAAGWWIPADIR